MITTTLEQMITHLQFLGYEIRRDGDLTRAKHPSKFNIAIKPFAGGFLFTVIFGCSDNAKRNKLSYLELINSLNAKAAIARFYADEDFDFFIEAWYPNYYDRTGFGAFLETLDRDYRLLVNSEADQYLE